MIRSCYSRRRSPTRRPAAFRPRCEALEAREVPATFLVTNTNDGGAGSLRQAILDANNSANVFMLGQFIPDKIHFAIGTGPQTIQVNKNGLGALPAITESVVIDGTTQPGFAGKPIIELDGNLVNGLGDGLTINGSGFGSTIQGLVIGRFGGAAVHVGGNNNTIQGNYLGTDLTGTQARPNQDGLFVAGSFNLIGGPGPGQGNLLSGNGSRGIVITLAATGNKVQGNFIGTDATGTKKLANSSSGILLDAPGNQIGGATPGEGNLISGNNSDGMEIFGQNNVVQGNRIGTDVGGTQPLGNADAGVYLVNTTGNLLGGTPTGAGNVIAFNDGDGVRVYGGGSASNGILGNSIFANAGLGINLLKNDNQLDGVTPNDVNDVDTGPNGLQNYPELTSAVVQGGQTTVTGQFNGTAFSSYRLEFFSSPAGDPSGFGEGQTFLGATTVTLGAGNTVAFTFTASVPVPAGHVITATASRVVGAAFATSEFSPGVGVVKVDPPPPVQDVTPLLQVLRTRPKRIGLGPRYRQRVTLVNAGPQALAGPLTLVLDGLRKKVRLKKPDGFTQALAPVGSPYRVTDLGPAALNPGEARTVVLRFSNPLGKKIKYTPRVLVGVGTP
jgi:trimeric autotransporter adhesin